MRYSHQRELILREVEKRIDYPTAEQICTSLREVCPRLSLGTVYRDLNTLVEIGKVRRVSIPGAADRFDSKTDVHQHFYCRVCQKVFRMNAPGQSLSRLIVRGAEGRVEDYNLVAFGICADCMEKQPKVSKSKADGAKKREL